MAYSREKGALPGFPRYGTDLVQQADTVKKLGKLDWSILVPGHGEGRDYRGNEKGSADPSLKEKEIADVVKELKNYSGMR
mmetsp:Transcript_17401/g.40415  ORF Transcript_17401/g.40415 Transcript_17401/m.40415 type:complete len:80 (-) Transcript_17401:950-1189(-)